MLPCALAWRVLCVFVLFVHTCESSDHVMCNSGDEHRFDFAELRFALGGDALRSFPCAEQVPLLIEEQQQGGGQHRIGGSASQQLEEARHRREGGGLRWERIRGAWARAEAAAAEGNSERADRHWVATARRSQQRALT